MSNTMRRWGIIKQIRKWGLKAIDSPQRVAVDDTILIAVHTKKWRYIGELDWIDYTTLKPLITAYKENKLNEYIKENKLTIHNLWKDKEKENNKKAYYAQRSKNYV